MANLTVIILTRNEEANLPKCFESLRKVAARVVIVDSFSTDQTVQVARKWGAEVFEHAFESHAAQFNWALGHIGLSTEWVMKLDADEELLPELAAEIEERLDALPRTVNGVILRRRVYFMGRWLRHGGKYPELLLRIFRTGHGMSEMKRMDEHLVITDGEAVTFKHDFCDNNPKSLDWWIGKHNWYSDKEVFDRQAETPDALMDSSAQSRQARLKRWIKKHGYYSLPKFFRAHLYFIYRYYLRLGFLDGKEGKIYTFLQSYWYRFLVDAKMYECEKTGRRMPEPKELRR